jgi:hypothetical protein
VSPSKIVHQDRDEEEFPHDEPFIPRGSYDDFYAPSAVDTRALKEQLADVEKKIEPDDEQVVADILATTNPYEACMLEAERRQLVDYEKHLPLYIASIGAHIANQYSIASCGYVEYGSSRGLQRKLENAKCFVHGRKPILRSVEGGTPRDLRVHIMIVGPPGSGKSVLPKTFLGDAQELIPIDLFPSKFLQRITSAGLFGSVSADPKNPKEGIYEFGQAFQFCSGFLACEEFNFVKGAATASYNPGMEDMFLTFLDNGQVSTTMKYGAYSYSVGTTAWFGNQTDRMWFGSGESGLNRRLAVDYLFMDEAANREFKTARRHRLGIGPNTRTREHIRGLVKRIAQGFKIETFELSPEYVALLQSFDVSAGTHYMGTVHFEETIFDRIAIGYNIMRYWTPGTTHLKIRLDANLESLIRRQLLVRQHLFAYKSILEAELVLRLRKHEGRAPKEDLIREMVRLGGYSAYRVEKTIDELLKRGRVVSEINIYENRKKQKQPAMWNPIIALAEFVVVPNI